MRLLFDNKDIGKTARMRCVHVGMVPELDQSRL